MIDEPARVDPAAPATVPTTEGSLDESPLDVDLQAALDAVVGADVAGEPGVRVSYQLRNAGGVVAERGPDDEHYAASTMKLPLVLAAYRGRDAGTLDPQSMLTVHNSFSSSAGGTFGLDPAGDSDQEVWARSGQQVSLGWLCRRSIVRSSNLATDLVLEVVRPPAIAEAVAACGAEGIRITRGIGDVRAQRSGHRNVVTVAGLNAILWALAEGTAAAPATCREVLQVLADNEIGTDVRAGLPAGTWVAHKNGWVDDAVLDAALVRPGGPQDRIGEFALSVAVGGDRPQDRSHRLIQRLARTVWDATDRRRFGLR